MISNDKSGKRKVITTEDGSSSLFVPELNEQYHSVHGAIQESMHVFIENGLKHHSVSTPVKILEIGFGTGLNALLTLVFSNRNKQSVIYHTIEKYPLQPHEVKALNYAGQLKQPGLSDKFFTMHNMPWGEELPIDDTFMLKKINTDLKEIKLSGNYDLVYFDAFGPDIQPDLWTTEVFKEIYNNQAANGILVTYSAKGQVRRDLISAGYTVERIPGPPGKRQMIRAVKA